MAAKLDRVATPNRLCQLCKDLVAAQQTLHYGVDVEDFHHHESLSAFYQSANSKECHLCSIMLDTFTANFGKDRFDGLITEPHLKISDPLETADAYLLGPISIYIRSYRGYRGRTRVPDCQDMTALTVFPRNWPVKSRIDHDVLIHRHQKRSPEKYRRCRSVWEKPQTCSEEINYSLSASTGSPAAYQLIRKWITVCQTTHEKCAVREEEWRPTRILDLRPFDYSEDIRLVEGNTTGNEPWVTLSYCWGLVNSLKLLPSNKAELEDRIGWNDLPKTMQDAVSICRNLSVRYLWIDALCIIQGPHGDFQQEASRMEAVYAGSLFTIAAAASDSSIGGCLRSRPPLQRTDCLLAEDSNWSVFAEARSACGMDNNTPGTCAIDTRGWVLQERVLSPRTVYFGQNGIHWECRTTILCDRPLEIGNDHNTVLGRRYQALKEIYSRILSLPRTLPPSPDTLNQFQDIWAVIIKEYTQTNLTKENDRLLAVAGILSAAQQKLKLETSFGIWTSFLLDDLLWYMGNPRLSGEWKSDFFEGLPSWSWLKVKGVVSTIREFSGWGTKATVASASVLLAPPPTPFVPLPTLVAQYPTPPSIRIRGRLAKCRVFTEKYSSIRWGLTLETKVESHGDERTEEEDDDYSSDEETLPEQNKFRPDDPTFEPTSDIFCLLIKREFTADAQGRWKNDPQYSLVDYGLVLTSEASGASRYRRIGMYEERWMNRQSLLLSNQPAATTERVNRFGYNRVWDCKPEDVLDILKLYMRVFPEDGPEEEVEVV